MKFKKKIIILFAKFNHPKNILWIVPFTKIYVSNNPKLAALYEKEAYTCLYTVQGNPDQRLLNFGKLLEIVLY